MFDAQPARPLRIAIAFGLLGWLALQAAAIEGPPVLAEDARFRVVVEDPALISELPALDWLAVMGVADDALSQLLGGEASSAEPRLVILADAGFYPRRSCVHDYDRHVARGAAAFFSRACGKVHVQLQPSPNAKADLTLVLQHETVHQRVALEGRPEVTRPGAWIWEGVAVFAEALDDQGRVATDGSRRLAEARMLFRSGRLLPLTDYLDLDAAELHALGSIAVSYSWQRRTWQRSVSQHHTQAASVMAYLHTRHPAATPGLIQRGLDHGLTYTALEQQLGLSPGELQRDYEAFFRSMQLKGVDF